MKRIFVIALSIVAAVASMYAQAPEIKYVDALELTLTGKLFYDTPNPYHRVDTVKYKGFTNSENNQIRSTSGLAIVFKTNSTTISVLPEYGYMNMAENTMGIALRGFDLYIKDENGKWLFAGNKTGHEGQDTKLINNMDNSMKECMIYLPIYSELYSLKVGVAADATIEAAPAPFRHRVGIFGSSYTQGISSSRPGMTYPAQFTRHTGIQLLSLGCSGNCKLQPYFADVLKDADVDALIFDAFSNPSAKMINERLFAFIESLQEAHPDIPLIFMQTIHRCNTHFDLNSRKYEQEKRDMAEKLMKEACKKYKNVYFVQTCAHDDSHESSVDGTHPDDYGYALWAKSIEKPICKILRKYGIR